MTSVHTTVQWTSLDKLHYTFRAMQPESLTITHHNNTNHKNNTTKQQHRHTVSPKGTLSQVGQNTKSFLIFFFFLSPFPLKLCVTFTTLQMVAHRHQVRYHNACVCVNAQVQGTENLVLGIGCNYFQINYQGIVTTGSLEWTKSAIIQSQQCQRYREYNMYEHPSTMHGTQAHR